MDYNPQLAYDGGGHVIAVWERVKNEHLPITSTLDITYTRQIEIAYAIYNLDSETWSAPAYLTENNLLDRNPQLARGQDGKLTLAWVEKPDGDFVDITHPINLRTRVWDGSAWSPVTTAAHNLSGLLRFSLARYDASQASLLLAVDNDADLSDISDQDLYYCTWNGSAWSPLTQLTDNAVADESPTVLYRADGSPQALWLSADRLMLLEGTWSGVPISTTLSNSSGTLHDYRTGIDASGNLALMWQSQDSKGANLSYARYDRLSQTWSGETALTDESAMIKQMAPTFTYGGDLLVGYVRQEITYGDRVISPTLTITNVAQLGQADLYVLRHTSRPNPTINQVALSKRIRRPVRP